MCGIVGIISKGTTGLYYADLDVFENMLVCDSLRGEDSTGVFGVYKNRQARTLKVAAEPHMLFRCPEWTEFRSKATASMQVIVGHNRAATKGAVNTTNAHPFNEGKIVLVHNGTLHNHKDFNKDVEVDSHAITHALNERPAKDVLKEIDGAFAFVWYDREQQKVFVARNSERPLSFVESSTNIYFASEGGLLEYVLGRKPGTVSKPESFPVGKIISFDSQGKREEEDFEIFRPKYQTTHYQRGYTAPTSYLPKKSGGNITGDTVSFDLAKGTRVLIKVDDVVIPRTQAGTIRVRGKLLSHEPGTDCSGLMATEYTLDDMPDIIKMPYMQAYISSKWSSTCGNSYNVTGIEHAEHTQLYNTKIPTAVWNHIVDSHTCDKCGSAIQRHETALTSVKLRGNTNNYRVVCSDCVMEAINEKPFTNIQNSNTEVPQGQSVSESSSSWPFPGAPQNNLLC
jgi:hypothetical protein